MATAARQSKGPPMKKPQQDSNSVSQPAARRPAWGNNRGSPSPVPSFAAAAATPRATNGFPPLSHANGSKAAAAAAAAAASNEEKEKLLTGLAGHIGASITVTLKSSVRYEGTLATVTPVGTEDGSIVLKNVKDADTAGAPVKESLLIHASSLASFQPQGAAKPADSFRTDTEISRAAQPKRERELQAWQPDSAPPDAVTANNSNGPTVRDSLTFGTAAGSGRAWDQFAVNERLFGVKTQFDEDAYTTKLNRNAKDFKEREKVAERIAAEITGSATNNPHVAEERNMIVDDNETNEEDKYGAVVRAPNAYVPPNRRPSPSNILPKDKPEIPKLSVNGPDGAEKTLPGKATSPPVGGSATKAPADALPAFRDFVTNEKQRLTQKKQAIVKKEMDKRMAELVEFSQSFKLNKPIPEDLVSILAKDEEKQKQIREKSTRDAASAQARTIGVSSSIVNASNAASSKVAPVAIAPIPPHTARPGKPALVQQKPLANAVPSSKSSNSITPNTKVPSGPQHASNGTVKLGSSTTMPKINMVIQAIPPFRGKKTVEVKPTPANVASPLSPTSAQRLNVNATSFKPNPKAVAFTPVTTSSSSTPAGTASPKVKSNDNTSAVPNPFFGSQTPRKGAAVSVKDDFNPFRHNKVAEASAVSAIWPYNGKRYMQMFPVPPTPPPQSSPRITHTHPPPHPQQPPQPTFEEDPAAQAAARGYAVYAYAPYGYPGQPPHQPMMGMPGVPPGFVPAPYMQHIPYPPNMPPPPGQPMYAPPMGQMPPYMPPPGAYPPPPNGAGPRPSMPPTPIPAHAHPYYHQSPHLQHAVPYMMMPPPGPGGPPHHFEGAPPPPVQMGNVGHV